MATARALAPLLVFFLLVNTAPAARNVADTVQELCSKSQFPKICLGRLTQIAESQKASPRRLAELFVNIAAEAGFGMAAFVHGKINSAKDDSVLKCYDSCSDEVEEAVAHLTGLVREPTDGKFLELKSWLSSTLGGTSACEDACKDAPQTDDKDAVVKYSVDIEKMLRIALDLITEASGSMSAEIALPPSDASAPSYGASAPFGGYGSSAEAPGPVSTTPVFPEGDASSPAYGGPVADAFAPSVGSSEAPGPSVGSSGVPGPYVESSEAPGPSVAASQTSDDAADAPAPDDASDTNATA